MCWASHHPIQTMQTTNGDGKGDSNHDDNDVGEDEEGRLLI